MLRTVNLAAVQEPETSDFAVLYVRLELFFKPSPQPSPRERGYLSFAYPTVCMFTKNRPLWSELQKVTQTTTSEVCLRHGELFEPN